MIPILVNISAPSNTIGHDVIIAVNVIFAVETYAHFAPGPVYHINHKNGASTQDKIGIL